MGDALGMSPKVMKNIGSKFDIVSTQCSEAIFSEWLNKEEGRGDNVRTWGTVLTVLEDAGRRDLTTAVLEDYNTWGRFAQLLYCWHRYQFSF